MPAAPAAVPISAALEPCAGSSSAEVDLGLGLEAAVRPARGPASSGRSRCGRIVAHAVSPPSSAPRRRGRPRRRGCAGSRRAVIRWHAAQWPGRTSSERRVLDVAEPLPAPPGSACGSGSRSGGSTGLGTSPVSTTGRRLSSAAGSGMGTAREQRLRVGVHGLAVERRVLGELDDASQVHDGHAVGDVAHDGEVVGDEQVGEPELALQLLQQVDDLRPDGDVEGADGLVADDEVGLHGERPGDADALALAAARTRAGSGSGCWG